MPVLDLVFLVSGVMMASIYMAYLLDFLFHCINAEQDVIELNGGFSGFILLPDLPFFKLQP